MTHRRVAAEADLPLASTTYWFASKDELLVAAYTRAAELDVARLDAAADELERRAQPRGRDLPRVLARLLERELATDRAGVVAGFALYVEAARRPELREVCADWTDAYVRTTARLLRAVGAAAPEADARLVVALLDGLLLEQVAADDPLALRPALERLLGALLAA